MDKPKTRPPPSPSQPHANTASSRPPINLKSLLMKCAIASTPAKKTLTPHQKAFIEKRFDEIFPGNIRTPDHPPYAWMIENAITRLNEECGSTSSEESISNFILTEYKDLPFAHAALLNHHLNKLYESGELVRSRKGCYSTGKSRTLHNRTSKPITRFTDTRSLFPVLSSTTEPSSSSYQSTSTYSSGESFIPHKGRKVTKRRKIRRKKGQKKRGINIHTKQNTGFGRGCGSGSGRSEPEDMFMEVYNVDRTTGEAGVESRALENVMMIEPESPGHANRIDSERIESLKEEKLVSGKNGSMATSGIHSSCRKKVISEQGSENDGPHKRTAGSGCAPQNGIRRGRPCSNRDMQMVVYGKNVQQAASEVGTMEENVEESRLLECDELIDEVFKELKGETERHNNSILERSGRSKGENSELMEIQYIAQEDVIGGTHIVNDSARKNELALLLQKQQRQELNKTVKQVTGRGVEMEIIGQSDICEGDPLLIEEMHVKNTFQNGEKVNREVEFGHCDNELYKCEGQFGLSTPEKSVETNQCRKQKLRPSKNESNDVANRAEPLAARHVLRKQRQIN